MGEGIRTILTSEEVVQKKAVLKKPRIGQNQRLLDDLILIDWGTEGWMLGGDKSRSKEDLKSYLNNRGQYGWVITSEGEIGADGFCLIYPMDDDDPRACIVREKMEANEIWEISYAKKRPPYDQSPDANERNTLMTDAITQAVGIALNDHPDAVIIACTSPYNPKSSRIVERVGFEYVADTPLDHIPFDQTSVYLPGNGVPKNPDDPNSPHQIEADQIFVINKAMYDEFNATES